MIEGTYLYGAKDDLSDVFKIRKKVYIEEENLSEELEFDGFDKLCVHGIIEVKGKKLGTGRILYDGDIYRIGHIAILKEERGNRYGDFLVRMLIDRAFLSGAEGVVVGAKLSAISFYEKIGFKKIGDMYTDKGGIDRIDMEISKKNLYKKCQS